MVLPALLPYPYICGNCNRSGARVMGTFHEDAYRREHQKKLTNKYLNDPKYLEYRECPLCLLKVPVSTFYDHAELHLTEIEEKATEITRKINELEQKKKEPSYECEFCGNDIWYVDRNTHRKFHEKRGDKPKAAYKPLDSPEATNRGYRNYHPSRHMYIKTGDLNAKFAMEDAISGDNTEEFFRKYPDWASWQTGIDTRLDAPVVNSLGDKKKTKPAKSVKRVSFNEHVVPAFMMMMWIGFALFILAWICGVF